MALLYCAAAMSGAFSGLLAAGIARMRGLGGLNGKIALGNKAGLAQYLTISF